MDRCSKEQVQLRTGFGDWPPRGDQSERRHGPPEYITSPELAGQGLRKRGLLKRVETNVWILRQRLRYDPFLTKGCNQMRKNALGGDCRASILAAKMTLRVNSARQDQVFFIPPLNRSDGTPFVSSQAGCVLAFRIASEEHPPLGCGGHREESR
jgi:hypothetical protein